MVASNWVEGVLARRGITIVRAVKVAGLGANTAYSMFQTKTIRVSTLGALLKVAQQKQPLTTEEKDALVAMLVQEGGG